MPELRQPLEITGTSANLTWYRERGAQDRRGEFVYAEVICNLYALRGARKQGTQPVPSFGIRLDWIKRGGTTRVRLAEFTYAPKTRPPGQPPQVPAITMTRLIRGKLAELNGRT